jgi:cytochrome c-type biogenesis protein CcmH
MRVRSTRGAKKLSFGDKLCWSCLVLVVAGALAWAGFAKPAHLSRLQSLEGEIRCPSCADVSVAQSDAPTAIAIRSYMASAIKRGESNSEIVGFLESRYGESILLSPPGPGARELIEWVPLAIGGSALAGVAVRFARRGSKRTASQEDYELVERIVQERP